MTLVTICTDALSEIGNWDAPATIINNSNPTAKQLLAIANRSGKTLTQLHFWNALIVNYTFPTVNGTASYSLPADFRKFANLTFWDNSNIYRVKGPVSPQEWQVLKSSAIANAAFWKYFRMAGGLFYIHPTPSAVETIAYQYYSGNWITGKSAFSDDSDVPLLDADMMTLDVRWRFLRAKGAPFDDEKDEFEKLRDSLIAADGAKDAIRFGRQRIGYVDNLPEANFG